MGITPTAGGAEPVGIDFDGTNDYLSRIAGLTGAIDGKTFTFSSWFYITSTSGDQRIYHSNDTGSGWPRFAVALNLSGAGANLINVVSYPTDGTVRLNINTAANSISTNTWMHVLVSVDMSSQANSKIYINDVNSAVTFGTFTNTNLAFNNDVHNIGAETSSAGRVGGRLAGVYLDYTYRNLSVEANRRLFIDADGRYVKPPTTGIISVPMDDPEDPARNDGTGGNFTLNGTVARSGRGPNQYNAAASTIDGSNDFLSKTSLSYGSDGKTASSSVQFKIDTQTNNIIVFALANGVSTRAQPLRLTWSGTKYTVTIDHNLTTGPTAFQFRGTDPISLGKWYQVDWSVDLTNTANRHVLINGVAANGTWSDYLNTNLDFSSLSEAYVGAAKAAVAKLNGEIGTVWYKPNQYIDLSVDNPFYDTETDKPKYLGANGELPTGSSPLIYLPLRADDAGNNLGTGGDFTVNSGPYVGARGSSEYWAESAKFNGTNQYLQRLASGSSALGASNGKVASFAVAYRGNGAMSSNDYTFGTGTNANTFSSYFSLFWANSSGRMNVIAKNSAGTNIYVNTSTNAYATDAWHVMLCSFDLGNSLSNFWIDGVNNNVASTLLNDTVAFSQEQFVVAGLSTNTSYLSNQNIGFFWFNTEYIDFSQEANRLKFFDAFNFPVDVGEDGSLPTGNQPLIYMNEGFHLGTNLGSGGNFTPVNTPTDGGYVKG